MTDPAPKAVRHFTKRDFIIAAFFFAFQTILSFYAVYIWNLDLAERWGTSFKQLLLGIVACGWFLWQAFRSPIRAIRAFVFLVLCVLFISLSCYSKDWIWKVQYERRSQDAARMTTEGLFKKMQSPGDGRPYAAELTAHRTDDLYRWVNEGRIQSRRDKSDVVYLIKDQTDPKWIPFLVQTAREGIDAGDHSPFAFEVLLKYPAEVSESVLRELIEHAKAKNQVVYEVLNRKFERNTANSNQGGS